MPGERKGGICDVGCLEGEGELNRLPAGDGTTGPLIGQLVVRAAAFVVVRFDPFEKQLDLAVGDLLLDAVQDTYKTRVCKERSAVESVDAIKRVRDRSDGGEVREVRVLESGGFVHEKVDCAEFRRIVFEDACKVI